MKINDKFNNLKPVEKQGKPLPKKEEILTITEAGDTVEINKSQPDIQARIKELDRKLRANWREQKRVLIEIEKAKNSGNTAKEKELEKELKKLEKESQILSDQHIALLKIDIQQRKPELLAEKIKLEGIIQSKADLQAKLGRDKAELEKNAPEIKNKIQENEAYIKDHPPETRTVKDKEKYEYYMKKADEYWALSNFHRNHGNIATANAFRADAYEYERKAREEAYKEIKIKNPEAERREKENSALTAELSKINQYENQINAIGNEIKIHRERIKQINDELEILKL